jgi:hypothetical protein
MRTCEVPGSGQALARRERLRKVASGKSVQWREATILLLGALQFFLGALALLVLGASTSSIVLLATGVLSSALALWLVLNARIDAIWALVNSDKPA